MATYLSFLAFAALLAVAPGPDTFLTLRASVVGGRRRGLFTAAGISTAGALQGLLAAMGLGAVLAASEPVFQTIRWAGVVYLTWLGVGALRAALRRDGSAWTVGSGRAQVRRRTAFRQGFVCNVTNPKVLAFNLAVLPQFVDRGAGHVPVQMLLLGLVAFAIGLVSDGVWAVVASALRGWFARSPRRGEAVGALGGASMVGLGVALAVTGHRK